MSVDVLRWEGLLQGEELAHLTTEPEREARFAPLPDELDARVRDAIGVDALYAHQRAAWDAAARGENVLVTTGTASGKTLAFNLPVLDRIAREPKTASALPLSDEGARAGSVPHALRVEGAEAPARDLRRRHAERAAVANPEVGERRADEPGHGPRRVAAEPRPLGRRAREPPLRRGGRGPRVPRRLRLPRRERAPAAAAARACLRLRAAVPARFGDRLESRRARRLAARRARDGGRRRRGAAHRAHDRALEPGAAGRGARPPRLAARRGREAPGDLRRARPPDADVREEPEGGGADPPVHRRAARRRHASLALPRRLHGSPAARDRAAALGGRPARRVGDERARARHRRRACSTR